MSRPFPGGGESDSTTGSLQGGVSGRFQRGKGCEHGKQASWSRAACPLLRKLSKHPRRPWDPGQSLEEGAQIGQVREA